MPADLSSWIAKAREAIARATPGKWKANLYLGGAYAIDRIAPNGDVLARVAVVDGLLATPANARAIVLAVNALPALLAIAEAAAEEHGGLHADPECPICAALARLAEEEAIRDR
jgi:hypothetical protein